MPGSLIMSARIISVPVHLTKAGWHRHLRKVVKFLSNTLIYAWQIRILDKNFTLSKKAHRYRMSFLLYFLPPNFCVVAGSIPCQFVNTDCCSEPRRLRQTCVIILTNPSSGEWWRVSSSNISITIRGEMSCVLIPLTYLIIV